MRLRKTLPADIKQIIASGDVEAVASTWSIASGRWISGAASSSRTGCRRGSLKRSSTRPRLRCRSCAPCSGWSSAWLSARLVWGVARLRRGRDAHAGV